MSSLLIHNAVVWNNPACSAILIRDGSIASILTSQEAIYCKSDERFDAKRQLLLPSFFDAHIHLSEFGLRLNRLDLTGCSLSKALRIIENKIDVTSEGSWILGGGWMKNYFGEFPTAKVLDNLSTKHYIALQSQDAHAVWCNTPVFSELLQKSNKGEMFSEKELPKDSQGNYLGIALERAAIAIASLYKISPQEKLSALYNAQSILFELGITDVLSIEDHRALSAFNGMGEDLKLRVGIAIYLDSFQEAKNFFSENRNPNLSLNAVKLFIDGSLGAETCSMLSPFENTLNFGLDLYADADLINIFNLILREGLLVSVHAIGDKAVRRALNTFQEIQKSSLYKPHCRIEHSQLIHDDDLSRFASLGIVPSMQPIHIKEDIATARRLLGERQRQMYRFNSLRQSGASVVFGSDAPIESPNVFAGLFYAVARRDKDGNEWFPDERLSLNEALSSYTEVAHRVIQSKNNGNKKRGRIDLGYEANLVIVPSSIFDTPEALLNQNKVLTTFSAGEKVYSSI